MEEIAELREEVASLKTMVNELKEDVREIKEKVDNLDKSVNYMRGSYNASVKGTKYNLSMIKDIVIVLMMAILGLKVFV